MGGLEGPLKPPDARSAPGNPGRSSTPIIRFDSVDSTQVIAFALAAEGALDRTVVVADYQAAGRGRRGRAWVAERGTSLLASIVVRPRLAVHEVPLLSFVTAVAVADAVTRLSGVDARLKWPNDVLVRGRKLAGILLESRGSGPAPVVVIGIGLNLRQRSFPDDVGSRATSIFIETGVDVECDQALESVLEEFDRWRGRLEREGIGPVRERWLALSETVGRRVSVDGIEGTAVDLAMDGALVIDDGVGHKRVVAGEVAGSEHAARR